MVSRRQRFAWGLAALIAGVALVGGLAIWQRSRHSRPRLAWRRPASHDPAGIIIHHSDTPGVVRGEYVGAALIDRSHQRRGFRIRYRGKVYRIGYHYVIREDGMIEPGRPEHCLGAHSKHHNDYLGICLVGNFSPEHNPHLWTPSEPTGAQLHSLLWLCSRLMAKYHISPDHVIRHSDVRETACPGDRFPFTWLQASLQQQWTAAALQPASSPESVERATPSGPALSGRNGETRTASLHTSGHVESPPAFSLLRVLDLSFRRLMGG
jgi:hypothetical protein